MGSCLQIEHKRCVVAPLVVLHEPLLRAVQLQALRADLVVVLHLDLPVRPVPADHHLGQRLIGDLAVYGDLPLDVRRGARQGDVAQLQVVEAALPHLETPPDPSAVLRHDSLLPRIGHHVWGRLVVLQIHLDGLLGQRPIVTGLGQVCLVALLIGGLPPLGHGIWLPGGAVSQHHCRQEHHCKSRSDADGYF